jgi:hypothetical protein
MGENFQENGFPVPVNGGVISGHGAAQKFASLSLTGALANALFK